MAETTQEMIERTKQLVAELEALVLRAKALLLDQYRQAEHDEPQEPPPDDKA